jgi:hypothetical protein
MLYRPGVSGFSLNKLVSVTLPQGGINIKKTIKKKSLLVCAPLLAKLNAKAQRYNEFKIESSMEVD